MLLFSEWNERDTQESVTSEDTDNQDTADFSQDQSESPDEFAVDLNLSNPAGEASGTEPAYSPVTSGGIGNIEGTIVKGSAISIDFAAGFDSVDDTFDNLTLEFRNGISLIGAERRIEFESQFNTPPQIRNGAVSLDVLECGESLCVAKYRANNESLLNEYTKSVFTSDDFDVRAIVHLQENATSSADVSRRYIFSHDPNVSGVSTPNGVIEFFEKKDE